MRKTKRLVKITAGRLVHCVCYTQAMPSDAKNVRAEKTKCSSLARRYMNFTQSWQKLQLKIAANFNRNDLYITLTYDDEHLPPSRKAADALLSKMLRQVASIRRTNSDILKYVRCTQECMDDGSRRLHHHLLINAGKTKKDYEMIRSLWTYGDNIDMQRISNTEHYKYDDFEELAKYLAKERNPEAPLTTVGARSWSTSKNLISPIRESEMVDDAVTVGAPPGAHILMVDEKYNEYGTYKYIRYLLPEIRKNDRETRGSKKNTDTATSDSG